MQGLVPHTILEGRQLRATGAHTVSPGFAPAPRNTSFVSNSRIGTLNLNQDLSDGATVAWRRLIQKNAVFE